MNWGGFSSLSQAWLALLLVPLVAFYFLKLKRPRLEVPSLFLWRQVMQDHRVNAPFQKFKRNLLLLLQILLLLLLVLAAMQPFWRGNTAARRRVTVLVDCSASMGAREKENGPTRLDEAKKRVGELINQLQPDQELSLISFGANARRQTGFTNDKRLLHEQLAQLSVTPAASNLDEPLRLAQALARTEPFEEVLLFSDGNFPMRAHFDLPFRLNFQRISPGGPNLGLTALNARRGLDGAWEIFAQVEASSGHSGAGTVLLERDGQEIGRERVVVARGRAQRLLFRFGADQAATLRLQLVPDAFDSLAADNAATLELPATRPLRVYAPLPLATYRRVLEGMGGLVVEPQTTNDTVKGSFDLVISDQAADLAHPARSRLWVGLVPAELASLVQVGTNGTRVVDWRRDAPVLDHVGFQDLIILDQPRFAAGATEADLEKAGYEVLVHGETGPLLVQRQEGSATTWALLFHTDRSTLPYRVGFPVLVANVVRAVLHQAGLAEAQGGASVLSPSETSLAGVDQIQFNERLSVAASAPLKSDRALWRALVLSALGVLLFEWWWFQRKSGGGR